MIPLPLRVQPEPSRRLRWLLAVLHLLALAALLQADLVWSWQGTGAGLLSISLWFGLRTPTPPTLRAQADGKLLILRGETWQPLQLSPSCIALPWLIVLRWREGWHHRALALPADSLDPDTHRRLRLWLRWKAGSLSDFGLR